jgi:3-deoxy-D-manno-octulosonate 8-phosphate phosphatase (KDO 8-P phosphatase)
MLRKSVDFRQITDLFKGTFLASPVAIQEKLFKIKAYIFDWDGIFNNGMKDENGSSPFSEVDAMGTNMLRFNHYLRKGQSPVTAVITGEKNNAAFTLANREHFHTVYYGMKNKKESLQHLCSAHDIEAHEVAFFFDDVIDFSIAELCGLRIMINRASNPLLIDYAVRNNYVDYITATDGGSHALRESIELLTGLSERYDDTIAERVRFSEHYQGYLDARNAAKLSFYTMVDAQITERTPQ